jgi:hypothetical protein
MQPADFVAFDTPKSLPSAPSHRAGTNPPLKRISDKLN